MGSYDYFNSYDNIDRFNNTFSTTERDKKIAKSSADRQSFSIFQHV